MAAIWAHRVELPNTGACLACLCWRPCSRENCRDKKGGPFRDRKSSLVFFFSASDVSAHTRTHLANMCGVIIEFISLCLRVLIFLFLLPIALVICFVGVIVYLIFLPCETVCETACETVCETVRL
jgi:hypothetical protein